MVNSLIYYSLFLPLHSTPMYKLYTQYFPRNCEKNPDAN